MSDAFGIAQLIDWVIVFALAECAALVLYHRSTGKGLAPRVFALNMISGLCLMAALRCVARDSGTASVALFLLGAGLAHGADIVLRWRRGARPATASRRVSA